MTKASIREIFCSVQGEGLYVGVRQVFVRFAGCNLACNYCDTPETRRSSEGCRVEATPGRRDFMVLENPMDKRMVERIIAGYGRVHSVSLTGGEPLLQADFIRELRVKHPLYLESNMTLPEEARKVRKKVSYVAGDFKLRDAVGEGYEEIREATIESFKTLRNRRGRKCFCKVVLQRSTDGGEVLYNVEQIKDYISTLVLQPVTPQGWRSEALRAEKVLELQKRLEEVIEVKVIPQTHRIWGTL